MDGFNSSDSEDSALLPLQHKTFWKNQLGASSQTVSSGVDSKDEKRFVEYLIGKYTESGSKGERSSAEYLGDIHHESGSLESQEENVLGKFLRSKYKESSPPCSNAVRNVDQLLKMHSKYDHLLPENEQHTDAHLKEKHCKSDLSQPKCKNKDSLLSDLSALNMLVKLREHQTLNSAYQGGGLHFDNHRTQVLSSIRKQSLLSSAAQNIPLSRESDLPELELFRNIMKSSTNEGNNAGVMPLHLATLGAHSRKGTNDSSKMFISHKLPTEEEEYSDDLIEMLKALEASKQDDVKKKLLASSIQSDCFDSMEKSTHSGISSSFSMTQNTSTNFSRKGSKYRSLERLSRSPNRSRSVSKSPKLLRKGAKKSFKKSLRRSRSVSKSPRRFRRARESLSRSPKRSRAESKSPRRFRRGARISLSRSPKESSFPMRKKCLSKSPKRLKGRSPNTFRGHKSRSQRNQSPGITLRNTFSVRHRSRSPNESVQSPRLIVMRDSRIPQCRSPDFRRSCTPSRSPRAVYRSPKHFRSYSPGSTYCRRESTIFSGRSSERNRSRSPVSPQTFRNRSPGRVWSNSENRSLSPRRDVSRSARNKSRSPRGFDSRPGRFRSRSPIRLRSRSPKIFRSGSPKRFSRSPEGFRSRFPGDRLESNRRFRSRSPMRSRSRSTEIRRSRSPGSYSMMNHMKNRWSPGISKSMLPNTSNRSPERYRSPEKYRSNSQDKYRSRSPARYNIYPERYRYRSPGIFRNTSPFQRSMSPKRLRSVSPRNRRSRGMYSNNTPVLDSSSPSVIENVTSVQYISRRSPNQYLWALCHIRAGLKERGLSYTLQITQDKFLEDVFHMPESLKDKMFHSGFQLHLQVDPLVNVRAWKDIVDNLIDFAHKSDYNMNVHVEARLNNTTLDLKDFNASELSFYFKNTDFVICIIPETVSASMNTFENMGSVAQRNLQPCSVDDFLQPDLLPSTSHENTSNITLLERGIAIEVVHELACYIPKPFELLINIGQTHYTNAVRVSSLKSILMDNEPIQFCFNHQVVYKESHGLRKIKKLIELSTFDNKSPIFEIVIEMGPLCHRYCIEKHEEYAYCLQSASFPITFIVQQA